MARYILGISAFYHDSAAEKGVEYGIGPVAKIYHKTPFTLSN